MLGFLTGTITDAFAYACFDSSCVLAPVALAGGLALWARISQARPAPYLRTRTGVAISGLIAAWPRESFLAFLATPFIW